MAAACAIPRPILVEMKARRRAYRARVAALLAVVVAALLSRTALAAQSVSESAPLGTPVPVAPAGGAGDLLRLAGALAVVVGLAFGIQWWLRRSGLASQWRGGAFEVLARHPVGRGQAVLVARFGTRVLLVQQSRDGLRTLAEVSDPAEASALLAAGGAPAVAQGAAVPAARPAERTVDLRRSAGGDGG
jgi:flagellar biogenesis protein FliO